MPEITNDPLAYGRFLLTLGIDPSELALDPILKGYDDFVASLVKAGYEINKDLFLASTGDCRWHPQVALQVATGESMLQPLK